MKIHIKRSFDGSCATYDSSCDIQRLVSSHLAEKTGAGHRKILEIGTGTGIYTADLLARFNGADITCVDIAHSLLKGAREKYPDLTYICGDGERLPLTGDFDLVTGSSTLQWFTAPEKTIPAMLSHMKKGGRFAFSVFTEGTFTEMAILNKMTGFGSVYDLRPDTFYRDIFAEFGGFSETREYVMHFDSVQDFLKKQKGTGATFSGVNRFASKSAYRKFLELYPELFGENGKIPVTYKIFYAWSKDDEMDDASHGDGYRR